MLQFYIEPDGDEFHVWVEGLPGCHSHGKSIGEALKNLKDAADLYFEDLLEESLLQKQGFLPTPQ